MKLGIALIFLSTAIFVALMVVPAAITPLAPLFCHAGEHLTNEQFTFSTPGETTTSDTFICADAQGNPRDITDNVMGASIVGFLALLLTGVGMTIFGGQRRAERDDPSSIQYARPTLDPSRPPRRTAAFYNPTDNVDSGQGKKRTLAETLRQIEDAHTQGLVNDDEYQTLRQEALDRLDE